MSSNFYYNLYLLKIIEKWVYFLWRSFFPWDRFWLNLLSHNLPHGRGNGLKFGGSAAAVARCEVLGAAAAAETAVFAGAKTAFKIDTITTTIHGLARQSRHNLLS